MVVISISSSSSEGLAGTMDWSMVSRVGGCEGGRWSSRSNYDRQRSGTGLIGPWVVGEPGTEPEILTAGGVSIVNIAPPGTCAVSGATVTLDSAILVNKCEWGALTSNVDIGRGSLGGLNIERRAGDGGHHGQQ